jgi:hypothetical protein
MSQDSAAAEANYRRFLERVLESGEVWGLQSKEGWAFCDSNEYEETEVLVFWSDRASAQKHAQAEWSGHVPTRIDLADFVERWLPGMDADAVLVGPDWDAEGGGLEVEPADLADALNHQADSDDGSERPAE